MEVTVLKPGPMSTIQDLGRRGFRAAGIPQGGAADALSLRLANLAAGNPADAAAIECTLGGPELEFPEAAVIAIGGGAFRGFPRWEPIPVAAGSRVAFGWLEEGCRACIAISGGIAVPPVLGSRSTCLAAGFGGFSGRALRAGDRLPIGAAASGKPQSLRDGAIIAPRIGSEAVLRIVPGQHAEDFDPGWLDESFRVSPESDRMGARLAGRKLGRKGTSELPSGPVVPGTVQVPPDGDPIVLLADAQTLGGYPQIAHVIAVDLPVAAQARPGTRVRFTPVTLDEAHRLYRERERRIVSSE